VQCNDFRSNQKTLQPSLEPFTAAAIVMVENRDAITRWRDGSWARSAGLAGELAQYRYVRVARIMLEAAFRTDHDLALTWPASKMPPAKDTVQIAEPVLHA
jgi:hypothetical protein